MKIFEIFFLFLIFIFLGIYVFNFQNINREWTSSFDMEFTLLYNSLLISDGFNQEYSDHPATTPIILLAIFLNILNIFNLVDGSGILYLNDSFNISDAIQNLTFYQRIFNLVFCFVFILIFYHELKKINKNSILLFSFIFFLTISSTFMDHIVNMRSEIFSTFFLFLSMIYFKKFFESRKYFYLILFNLFIYFSYFSKVQIILYLPFIFLFAMLQKDSFFYKFKFKLSINTKIIIIFIIHLSTFIALYIFAKKYYASNQSILVHFFFYILINALIAFNFKDDINIILKSIFIIITSHICFISLLILFNVFNTQISTFYDILRIKSFVVGSRIEPSLFIFNLTEVISKTFKSLFQFNITTILLSYFILILIFFYKKLKLKFIIFIILNLIFIFYSKAIILFRQDNLDYEIYIIFILPFAIYNILILFTVINNRVLNFSLPVLVLLTLTIDYKGFFLQKNPNANLNFCKYSLQEESYLDHWHKSINKDKVILFCKQNI
jgi:hypothetical protein